MVRMVVPQKAERTKSEEKNPVFPDPNDISGIKGSQGPRIKNTNRAKGVHRAKLEFFGLLADELSPAIRLSLIAHFMPQAK